MDNFLPKVCVIGAGPSGLVALRHFKGIADCVCYELKSQIGGLWVYNDTTDDTVDSSDEFYKLYNHTHESIYHDLTTIIPKWFFAYKDFPPIHEDQHLTHKQVLEYLEAYAEYFELSSYIKFNTTVLNVCLNHKYSDKKWKVTIQKDDTIDVAYFDYVLVCNGHNSVPYYPTEGISGLESFKGDVMHAHNIRKPDSEEFLNKSILFVGARWSGLDLLYQFLDNKRLQGTVDFYKIYVAIGKSDHLHNSENFKPFLDSGKIVFKDGKNLKFDENSVTFEDGTYADIDTVLFCTGYQFQFPFFSDSSLIQVKAEGKCFGPLYKRIFCINEPTLMFVGQSDNNPLIQIIMEKQVLVCKHFIDGKIQLPAKIDMTADYEQELLDCAKYGLKNLFKGNPKSQWKYIRNLKKLLSQNDIDEYPINEEFNKVLDSMIDIFREFIKAGNFIDFKIFDYSRCIPDSFEYDTTKYF